MYDKSQNKKKWNMMIKILKQLGVPQNRINTIYGEWVNGFDVVIPIEEDSEEEKRAKLIGNKAALVIIDKSI